MDQIGDLPLLSVANRKILPVVCIVCLWTFGLKAATMGTAHDKNGKPLSGIIVEGDIELGDAIKLQTAVTEYNLINTSRVATRIYLRSKGGDVEEAMKMGDYIHRLRLETEIPTSVNGHNDIFSWVSPNAKDNNICASACFLIFAGGVVRQGNMLALHRPYLPRETAIKISDLQYELIEKNIIAKVKKYLKDMEVDQFFVDKMMSNNSQDSYVVALWETDRYHLSGIVPSVEEIVLSKCNMLTSKEKQAIDAEKLSSEERERLFAKYQAGRQCESDVLDEMRREAFKRDIKNLAR